MAFHLHKQGGEREKETWDADLKEEKKKNALVHLTSRDCGGLRFSSTF